MSKPCVLLIEDELTTQRIVRELTFAVCELIIAGSFAEAEKELQQTKFALILLDVHLPDGDGFDFYGKFKSQYPETQIIFLTKKSSVDDRVRGLDLGAEDYITKPIEPREFLARLANRLRRGLDTLHIHKEPFSVDLSTQVVTLKTENNHQVKLELTPIEFKLFAYLLKHEGDVVLKADLLKSVWGSRVHVSAHTMETHISTLRKKLAKYGSNLRSVFRKGYSFSCDRSYSKSNNDS